MTPRSPEKDVGITQAVMAVVKKVLEGGTSLDELAIDTHGPFKVWRIYDQCKDPRIEVKIESRDEYRTIQVFVDRDRVVLVSNSNELDCLDLSTSAQLEQGERVVPTFCAIIEGSPGYMIARPAVLAKDEDANRQHPVKVRPLNIPSDDVVQVTAVTNLMTAMTEILQSGEVSFEGRTFGDSETNLGIVFREA